MHIIKNGLETRGNYDFLTRQINSFCEFGRKHCELQNTDD